MKRRAAALLATTAVLLAACGSDDGESASETTGAESGAFPATIETMFGPVTVEEQSERVVALGWGDAETALALGVEPVGASDWLAFGGDGVGPWVEDGYSESPEIIGTVEPSFEQIAALTPDLILDTASSGEQARYDTLSGIATTIGPPEGATAYQTPRDAQITMVATALGVPEKGEELVTELDEQFAQAAADHPEFAGKTVTVAAYTSDGWGAYVSRDARVQFLQDLGFVNNPAVEAMAGDNFFVPVSDENLGMLDSDLLLVLPIYVDSAEVTENPLFQQLPVVQDGRYLVLDSGSDVANAISLNSALSIPFALDQLVPQLAERVD
ncbi:iron-siderophore ABC transporter substrate-binding protein [Rhodococcus sp. Z13]|uniref:Iron-siderophore ABC transporter substrate-binding protein n=1 Tax=Rhodococcus sacchari TaxID=2962047 RepID=A0ACD4DBH0_9NOCA|nr:iron-siderophore ABC transporter substrate-binding protein [Rhodococcus sp. Z13]UYP17429.1 iron-siderophore ABC transporter substrate-binding protein [Rhodococcus sp. Z13]